MITCDICCLEKEDLVLVESVECHQSCCIECFNKLSKCPFCRHVDCYYEPIDIQTYYDKKNDNINNSSFIDENGIEDFNDSDYRYINVSRQLRHNNNTFENKRYQRQCIQKNINNSIQKKQNIKEQVKERYKFSKPEIKREMYLKYNIN